MQISNNNIVKIPTDKIFISPKELSKYINISVGTLAVWRTNRIYDLPYVKIGGRIMYPTQQVNEWLATQFANKHLSEIIQNSDAVFRRYHFGQRVCCGFLRRPLFFVLLKLNLGALVILYLVHQPPLIYQTGF